MEDLANRVETATTPEQIETAVNEWEAAHKDDPRLAEMLIRPQIQADLGGTLMVAAHETKRVELSRQGQLWLFQAEGPTPYMDQNWVDAIETFKKLDVPREKEFLDIIRQYSGRSAEERQLLLEYIKKHSIDQLQAALEDGVSMRQYIQNMDDFTNNLGVGAANPSYLQTVYRTNLSTAYGAGRWRALTDPDVVEERPYVQYRTVGDSRVRPEHAELDGLIFPVDDPEFAKIAPPNGYNCFPAGTLVGGKVEGGLRGYYAGEIMQLRTESGRRLTVTPNHPIATPDGFIAAGELHSGYHVLAYPEFIKRDTVGEIDEQDVPSRIENVYGALAENRLVSSVRPVANDLHGDAINIKGEIDIVWAYGPLALRSEAQRKHQYVDAGFRGAVAAVAGGVPVESERGFDLGLPADFPPAAALPRRRTLSYDGAPIHAGPFEFLRFGPAAQLDITRPEPMGDDAARDPEVCRQLLDRGAGQVVLDKLVDVNRFDFLGHVYDLQSPNGWIVVQGIVTSNCRCSVVSYIPKAGDEIAGSVPETYQPEEGFNKAPDELVSETLL